MIDITHKEGNPLCMCRDCVDKLHNAIEKAVTTPINYGSKHMTIKDIIEKKEKEELYKIVDCFLTESQDLDGNYRSIDRLNQDRHLAVENLMKWHNEQQSKLINHFIEMIDEQKKAIRQKEGRDSGWSEASNVTYYYLDTLKYKLRE